MASAPICLKETPPSTDCHQLACQIGKVIERVRESAPHVHSLTNLVANTLTANVLLAAGATPSMSDAHDEVAAFVSRADALLINLGTLSTYQKESMGLAIAAANEAGKPWVLDPVFVHFSPPRLAFARQLIAARPDLVRGNAHELASLQSGAASGKASAALGDEDTCMLAARSGAVIVRTGAEDFVTDAERRVVICNGHPLMSRVTGVGCAMTALLAAVRAVEPDGVLAATSTLAWAGIAGELAAEKAAGPGSFQSGFVDAIFRLTPDDVSGRLRISI